MIAPLLLAAALPSIAAEHIDIDIRDYRFAPSTVRIRVGDTVRAGTELARVGATGRAAGPHVHFEVRQGELALNPESFVKTNG